MSRLLVFRKALISLAICAVVVFGSATLANADTATFDLNIGSTLPSQHYGTVKLTLVNTNQIEIKVTLDSSLNKLVNTGFGATVAFNMAGANSDITVSDLPSTYSLVNGGAAPHAAPPNPDGTFLSMDGFGLFEYGVLFNTNGGGAGTDSALTFTVSRAAGFSSVFDLVANSTNPPGNISSPFAVDIICGTCPGMTPPTGVIGTGSSPVPEPATMFLLGSGLVGIAGGIRKRLRR